jgi:hypothetical protein
MDAALLRASPTWPALAVVVVLAAGPALATAPAPAKHAKPADQCFDRVTVVLNDKPHRDPGATAAGSGRQAVRDAGAADAHPILTLRIEQPRDCGIPLALEGQPSPPAVPLALEDGSADGFGAPARGALATAGRGSAAAPLKLGLSAAPPEALQDALVAGDPPIDGTTAGAGFVPFHSPAHLLAGGTATASPGMPDTGFSASASRRGKAPAADNPQGLVPPEAGPPASDPAVAMAPVAIPEPSAWLLFILGAFGLGAALRRRPARSAA